MSPEWVRRRALSFASLQPLPDYLAARAHRVVLGSEPRVILGIVQNPWQDSNVVSFAHVLDKVVHPLQPLIFLGGLVAWALIFLGLIAARRRGERRLPPIVKASILFFVAVIAAEAGVALTIQKAALQEVQSKLLPNVDRVEINGVEAKDSAGLVDALRRMRHVNDHHTHPTALYDVSLETSNGPVVLRLRRDSFDEHDYWVFYSGFHSTENNAIGHVVTPALDGM
jgi:hypothetical protein